MACMEGYIITLITFLHFPFSNVSSRCLHNWTKNCINYNSFDFLRYGFSMVSPWHFYQSTKSHTNCICLAFLQCAILYLSSIVACRVEHKFHFFDFSLWAFGVHYKTGSAPPHINALAAWIDTKRWALMWFLSHNQNWTYSCISQ